MTHPRACAACRKPLHNTGTQCRDCAAWYCTRAWPFCHYAHQTSAHRTTRKEPHRVRH